MGGSGIEFFQWIVDTRRIWIVPQSLGAKEQMKAFELVVSNFWTIRLFSCADQSIGCGCFSDFTVSGEAKRSELLVYSGC